MSWTLRQRAMLAEMGLMVRSPTPGPAEAPVEKAQATEPQPARPMEPPRQPVAQRPQPAATAPALRPAPAQPAPPLNQPLRIEQMDWPALQQAVADCQACKLCTGRTQTVFGVGSTKAQWLIVGEAPGEQEDQQGEPFVGKSGQLLDNMLRAIQCTRHKTLADGSMAPASQQVYITNAVKCHPASNRNPEPAELAQCKPFLSRQIELLQPRVILAMGRFAVQSLLNSSEPIGQLRGRMHQYQGVPLVVTYHPAYLLRHPSDKTKAWDDLCLALQAVHP